jgi:hypothetical protein
MSDINSTPAETYYWWRCRNCKEETKHTKNNNQPEPSREGCKANEAGSVFPLSSV